MKWGEEDWRVRRVAYKCADAVDLYHINSVDKFI